MGACKGSFEETCAKLAVVLVVGGGSMVDIVVALETCCRRVNEVAGSASTVLILAKMKSYFLTKWNI